MVGANYKRTVEDEQDRRARIRREAEALVCAAIDAGCKYVRFDGRESGKHTWGDPIAKWDNETLLIDCVAGHIRAGYAIEFSLNPIN